MPVSREPRSRPFAEAMPRPTPLSSKLSSAASAAHGATSFCSTPPPSWSPRNLRLPSPKAWPKLPRPSTTEPSKLSSQPSAADVSQPEQSPCKRHLDRSKAEWRDPCICCCFFYAVSTELVL